MTVGRRLAIATMGFRGLDAVGGGGCTAIADPIDITLEFNAVGVVTPAIIAVADQIDINLEVGGSIAATPSPAVNPVDLLPRTIPGDHGGQWIGRTGQGRALDRAIILGRGYTILDEEESSGLTKFIVHLTIAVLRTELEFPLINGDGLVYQLFPLPEGEIITAGLIRRFWPANPGGLIISS